jgi:hypothetical protein
MNTFDAKLLFTQEDKPFIFKKHWSIHLVKDLNQDSAILNEQFNFDRVTADPFTPLIESK